jgi:ATP-dependent DNA helicase PIF1
LDKLLYAESENSSLKDYELLGRNAYRLFTDSVLLTTIQRQSGDNQAAFRQALLELREVRVSAQSWELLSSRYLSQDEQRGFADAVRIYPTKERVAEYNYWHMQPVLYVHPMRVQVQQRPSQRMQVICLRLFLLVLAVESCLLAISGHLLAW